MPQQLSLSFDEVPLTCAAQERYHAIAPILAGKLKTGEQAARLDLSYRQVAEWLRKFRTQGLAGLIAARAGKREPYTPERIVVSLLYWKCLAPSASSRELARVTFATSGYRLHHETVAALLERYFFWRYREFTDRIRYPVPATLPERRAEIIKLSAQGWTDKRIAQLLGCSRNTVIKWLKRSQRMAAESEQQEWLLGLSRAPHQTTRKVWVGAIAAVLKLQRKYVQIGAWRTKGFLARDFGIELSTSTVARILSHNRRFHAAPGMIRAEEVREFREGPPRSRHPFEYVFIDVRYLDAKVAGRQLYTCWLLEGYSRTILAGTLATSQDLGVILRVYYLALLNWGCWQTLVSDHGGQFRAHEFNQTNRHLGISHWRYEKGRPWRNLLEAQFGIQARLGEGQWRRCKTFPEAEEVHRELIRDINRLPHFAHQKRNDGKEAPLEVLGLRRGQQVDAATLHYAFRRKSWKRRVDQRGFIRVGRWRVYVEEGLPGVSLNLTYWDGRLRAEYQSHLLAEYECKFDEDALRPTTISRATHHSSPFASQQQTLFDPLWMRDPAEYPVHPGQSLSTQDRPKQ
ncbi:MAG TPA: helix-turn-helix domain-containing protein [Blastocatellia bacterium]|nr:helix-turn-helix domain-containing protein [Blastocatellia bacterium]